MNPQHTTAVIRLDQLKSLGRGEAVLAGGCSSTASAGKSGCGSRAVAEELPAAIWEKVKDHPCYSEAAHHHYARMHVAVAPACNIQCNYCNRKYDCANESRPGVVSERLTPEQAARKVAAVAARLPQLSVLGIAGPGDPLANPQKTFETFERVAKLAPDLKLCLSTNGLALPAFVDRIAAYNIDHVTITINMIDPEIGQEIYPWIFWRHRRWTGREAAHILSEQQLLGLELLTERGILCKVNSVMIPGINDEHLIDVNAAVKARGAFLHNIMPLISAPEHGTVFGLSGRRGPTAQELKALQDRCAGGANLMRHCRQCRADAVGLLGEDRSSEFALDQLDERLPAYDLEARRLYRETVEAERAAMEAATRAERDKLSSLGNESLTLRIAVATRGHGRINEHFGHVREFQIYEVGAAGVVFIGHRRVDAYCQGGYGEEETLETVIQAIADCDAVFVAKIGRCPQEQLDAAGITVIDRYRFEYIEPSALRYYQECLELHRRGEYVARRRGDAQIRQGAYVAA